MPKPLRLPLRKAVSLSLGWFDLNIGMVVATPHYDAATQ
jgi:hypothetical protein